MQTKPAGYCFHFYLSDWQWLKGLQTWFGQDLRKTDVHTEVIQAKLGITSLKVNLAKRPICSSTTKIFFFSIDIPIHTLEDTWPRILTAALRWLSGKEPACHCRRHWRHRFYFWVGKMPWRRKWQLTPVFLPGKYYGQRSLGGNSPWGCSVRHDWATITLYCGLLQK